MLFQGAESAAMFALLCHSSHSTRNPKQDRFKWYQHNVVAFLKTSFNK